MSSTTTSPRRTNNSHNIVCFRTANARRRTQRKESSHKRVGKEGRSGEMVRRGTEAFPDLGAHCDKEDCNQLDFLPFDCDGCGKVFCAEHRTYRDHGCARAADQGRTVVVCEACSDAIEHGPGEAEGDQDSSSSSSPLDPSLAPLLLFDYRDGAPGEASDDYTVFFYSIPKRQLLTRRADDFRGHRYWTTPQGWVLMLHLDSHTTFLWNPLTLQRISLPLDQENLLQGTESRCLLSQKPTDPECVVLVLDLTDTVIYYCHPGGNQWFKHQYQLETHLSSDDGVLRLMASLTMVGGKFYAYWIDQFVRLEFSPNPIFKIDTLDDYCCFPTWYNVADFCILECCGELFGLCFCHPLVSYQKIMQIAVQKIDFSRGAWVKVDTLGDMVFFINIGRSYGASFDAREVDLKGNCIYFVTYDDKALHVYDMGRGTTTMHNPGPSLQDSIAPEFFMPPV